MSCPEGLLLGKSGKLLAKRVKVGQEILSHCLVMSFDIVLVRMVDSLKKIVRKVAGLVDKVLHAFCLLIFRMKHRKEDAVINEITYKEFDVLLNNSEVHRLC